MYVCCYRLQLLGGGGGLKYVSGVGAGTFPRGGSGGGGGGGGAWEDAQNKDPRGRSEFKKS